MKYQLITLELITENGEQYEVKDVRIFDGLEEAKCWVNQTILALKYNVNQKCAKKVEALDKWETESDGTLTRAIYYEESDKLCKYVTWMLSEKSIYE